ncbi:CaiB/BaiF CoA transferase family protein [Reyranella massiliensis]|uniref:CaiB/BaiF CoA transferase family protein n=1 Tax=Reyranella massiliensis TaxID=445220 RepID=UPI0002F5C498|nr:CaiB/BaiF CoA-transferase family protein [Reyranella massiliensis]
MTSSPTSTIEPPLKGIRVVELTHTILGPSCGMILADLGAEVIKVEPVDGDRTRKLRGFGAGFFGYFNRNKKSLALDADAPEGRAVLVKLLESADVLIENFAPGSMAKRKLGPAHLEKINPRLVYCSLKGFLPGPYEKRPALDEVVQMMGGLAYMTGPSGRPLRAGTSVVDIMGGIFGAFGTVLALKQRDRTGKGGLVESALFESVVFLMGQHLAITAMNGGAAPPPMPERVSSWAVYEIFNTADGQQVFIGITSDSQWKRFCEVFGQQELAADPRLATNNQRIEARPWLVPAVAEVFKRHDRAALEQLCLDADISFAPVARPQELFDHPHLLANGSLAPTTLPGGVQTRLPLLPFQMMGWRPPLVSDPPEIGQHNDEVLAALGYDAAGIGKLKAGKMLGPA